MFRFDEILNALAAGGVEFILVGGLASIAQSAALTTQDLDIVPERSEENLCRLDVVLEGLNAVFRARRDLRPNRSHTRARGHVQLLTDFGFLDVLMFIGDGLEYPDLVNDTLRVDFAGHELKVLRLERIIQLKEELGHAKDLAQLPILRSTLAARKARGLD